MSTPSLDDLKLGRSRLHVDHAGVSLVLRRAAPSDAPLLTAWRDANHRWFLTEFPADEATTRNWIAESGSRSDRILLIVEVGNMPVGHVGLREIDVDRGEAEVDNVVRGRPAGGGGLMSAALHAMLEWARQSLGICAFRLRVFADNPARDFYAKLGFTLVGSPVDLRFEGTPGRGSWHPTEGPVERALVEMELRLPVETGGNRADGAD